MARPPLKSFNDLLREAIDDLTTRGFVSAQQVLDWQAKLEQAAEREVGTQEERAARMERALSAVYESFVNRGGILEKHPGIPQYTLERLKPELRAELQKRIKANLDLIKLHKREEIEKMKTRFAGWATSQQAGGSTTVKKKEVQQNIRKSIAGLSYRERRLLIDQGHKMESAISSVIAIGGGAIAAIWRSHWKQTHYDFRPEHKRRAIESQRRPFVVRGNWAMEAGLMKLGNGRYTDDLTQPGEEPFCRCWYEYVYSLRGLPAEMITEKGRQALKELEKRRA